MLVFVYILLIMLLIFQSELVSAEGSEVVHPVSNECVAQEEMNRTNEKKGEELVVNSIKLFSEEHDDSNAFNFADTLEMRENLQRQLEEIMSATKMTTGRRTSVRLARLGSGGNDSGPNTPEGSRVGRMGNRRTLEALR